MDDCLPGAVPSAGMPFPCFGEAGPAGAFAFALASGTAAAAVAVAGGRIQRMGHWRGAAGETRPRTSF